MELNQALINLKNGERRALEDIYNETKRAVFAIAKGILGADVAAEDVMQDTYVKVCEKICDYSADGNGKAWICRIAKNTALDEYRRRKKLETLNENTADGNEFENDVLDRCGTENILKIAQNTLSKYEFLLVYMHTVGDMPHKEIAETLGKPYATVRWGYSAAIKKLKKVMSKQ